MLFCYAGIFLAYVLMFCYTELEVISMPLYKNLQVRLPEYIVEFVTTENLSKYEGIFYSNTEYYLITDGHPATKQDCIETVEFGNNYPKDMSYCIGISSKNEAVAFISFFEGYPDVNTLYIGLFLMNEPFKRKSIGTKIMTSLIEEAFIANYTCIKLSVQDNNISGYSFWTKLGFEITEKCECCGFCNLSMELKRGTQTH